VAAGFGVTNCNRVTTLAEFSGSLYAGLGVTGSAGGQIWRCTLASGCDAASDWSQVTGNGFGNPQNTAFNSLRVNNNALYAFTVNSTTGIEVWMSSDGTAWQQTGFAGFGDSDNMAGYWNNADIVFNGHLFAGTENWANGGEIWRLKTYRSLHHPRQSQPVQRQQRGFHGYFL